MNPFTKELFVGGQNYSMLRNAKGQVIGRGYEDMVLFHFDQQGKLMSQFVMNKTNKSTGLNDHNFEFSTDGKILYWTFFDNIDTKPVRELDVTIEKCCPCPKWPKSIWLTARSEIQRVWQQRKTLRTMVAYWIICASLIQTKELPRREQKSSTLWFTRELRQIIHLQETWIAF